MPWLERLYTPLLWLVLPLALLRLLWRSRRVPAYRQRWGERLAVYRETPPHARVWLHAVSVGEVQAAQPLIRHLRERDGASGVLVTTTTPTGAQRLASLFSEPVPHLYTPFDLPPVVRRFLDRVRPRVVVVMETEVWPNLLKECAARGIPVILANARMSQRSAVGYARLGRFAQNTFARFAFVAAQSAADAARLQRLGVPAERIRVTGSAKFDLHLPGSLRERAEVMRRTWGIERPVWVAASTHEGEEELLLAAHRWVREQWPAALLVLAPRHPERFDRVASLVVRQGWALARRSRGEPCAPETGVFLGDSMGELPVFLAAADAAFIGGSLVPVGGHNLVEAAAVGAPAVIGPQAFNFATVTETLVRAGAAVQVADARALARQITAWLGDAAERARIGENGLWVVAENRGATQRLIELVEEQLAGDPQRPACGS